jgi:hypothetical protein
VRLGKIRPGVLVGVGRMRWWGSFALILTVCAVFGAASSDAGSCRTKKSDDCFNMPPAINFSAVSDISRQIVSEEPTGDKPRTNVLEAPPITTYTGPTVGVSSMAHAPTVGYYWSLEPDSKNQ